MTNHETLSTEADHFLSLLGEQYEHLRKIAEETFGSLGKEQAGHFTRLANDWMNIHGAILDTYSRDELLASLMYLYLVGLFKEVYWFQLLLLTGNYPLLHRSLRFVWEMMFRAYYVDTYVPGSPGDPEPPDPTVDDKVEWMAEHKRKMYRWDSFVKPTLLRLLPQAKGTEMEKCYKSLWDKLNAYVHPSKALLDRMVAEAPGFLITDSFDKEWALETIGVTTMVFDLVWLAVLLRFPGCAGLLAQKGLHVAYPIVTTALGDISAVA